VFFSKSQKNTDPEKIGACKPKGSVCNFLLAINIVDEVYIV